jgi:hypothetical protein
MMLRGFSLEGATVRHNQYYAGEESSPAKTTAAIAAEMGISERIAQQRKQIARWRFRQRNGRLKPLNVVM